MGALKFGVTASNTGLPIPRFAQDVEALGFDSLWTGEHVVWRRPINDALIVLTAAAAVTWRIRLGTSILLLPLKHPVLVCKAATTLDRISGGRFSLGIGIGGENPKEFEAVGVPVKERGARANESLDLMKRLWTEDNVTFKGRFFQMTDITLEPKPVRKPHPPILVAGRRKALPGVAKYADGWMPYMYTPEMYREDWQKIGELAAGLGRDPAKIERTLLVNTVIDKTYEAAASTAAKALGGRHAQDFTDIVHKYAVTGTPEQCAERLAQFRDAGVEHFIFNFSTLEEQADTFPKVIAREVIPLLQRQ